MIDVGGIALLSAAARNYAGVAVVASHRPLPAAHRGAAAPGARVARRRRQRLAARGVRDRRRVRRRGRRVPQPHQRRALPGAADRRAAEAARPALRREPAPARRVLPRDQPTAPGRSRTRRRLQGPDPTFNDLLDLDAAYRIVCRLHGRPPAASPSRRTRWGWPPTTRWWVPTGGALDGDPVAAYGAVIACQPGRWMRRPPRSSCSAPTRRVAAPGFTDDALRVLGTRPALPLLVVPAHAARRAVRLRHRATSTSIASRAGCWWRPTTGWSSTTRSCNVVTRRRPTLEELTDLLFAWRAVRHVTQQRGRARAARGARGRRRGPGQPADGGRDRAPPGRGPSRTGRVLASDAYFPFADAIQLAGERGVTAIIQPGGSVRDEMAIEVADRHHMAMVFTGRRHFRH